MYTPHDDSESTLMEVEEPLSGSFPLFENDSILPFSMMLNDDGSSTDVDYGVAENQQKLKQVGLDDIPPDAMNVVTSYLCLTDHFSLSLCSKRMLHDVIPHSTHLFVVGRGQSSRISNSVLTQLFTRYTNLTRLHLNGVSDLGDSLFSVLNQSTTAKTLQSLSLNGVNLTYWCQEGLKLENLQELTILDSSIRASLSLLFGMGTHDPPSKLRKLTVSQSCALHDDQLKVLHGLNDTLTHLKLTQCMRLQRPRLCLQRLESLSLMGSFCLQDLPFFSCPSLTFLDLSFCVRLSNQTIAKVVQSLPRLEKLCLVKCELLRELRMESDSLRHLNVCYCDSLTTVRLKCPALQELVNDSCPSLDTLILKKATSLQDLNVSSLPLTRLEVMAPQLCRLNLANCRQLDQCNIQTPNLKYVNVVGCRMVALRFCKHVRMVQLKNWTRVPNHESLG